MARTLKCTQFSFLPLTVAKLCILIANERLLNQEATHSVHST
jgi:hypothetical protein